jgi:hypothetical protein
MLDEGDPENVACEKVFKAAWETIDQCTVPICFFHDNKMTFDRTGVLLQIGEMRFLVTAAHVGKDNTLPDAVGRGYIPCVMMPVKGLLPVPITSLRYMTTKDNNEDITVYLLTDDMASKLAEHYYFVRLTDVMSRTNTAHHHAMYLITGFPTAMEGQEPDASFVKTWYYLTRRYDGDYANIASYTPRLHLVVKYQRNTHDRHNRRVHPQGMSGCGIWFVANPVTWPLFAARDFRLVAIQTAWHRDHEYAKGTWIDLVLYIIWHYWSDSRDVMRLHGIEFSGGRR